MIRPTLLLALLLIGCENATNSPNGSSEDKAGWAIGTWASVNPGAPSDINHWHIEKINGTSISGYLEEHSGTIRPFLKGSETSGASSITLNTIDTASTCNDIWKPESAVARAYCIAMDSTNSKYRPRLLSWQGSYFKSTGQIKGEAKISWNGGITWAEYVYPFVAQKSE